MKMYCITTLPAYILNLTALPIKRVMDISLEFDKKIKRVL